MRELKNAAKKPLNEVAADLEARFGIPVRLDAKALHDVGIRIDRPVTFASAHVSAKATIALRKLPGQGVY